MAFVSSTVTTMLRQLIMFVFDDVKAVAEGHCLLPASELESITLPGGTTWSLGPAARDAFAIFKDPCPRGARAGNPGPGDR